MSGIINTVGAASGVVKGPNLLPSVAINTGTATSSGSEATYTEQGVGYRVHRFTSTQTDFVASGQLICDVLVVGGGGGGGNDMSGGGHAGGVCFLSNLVVDEGTYTITIGGGGADGVVGGTSSAFGLSCAGGSLGGSSTAQGAGAGRVTVGIDPTLYDHAEMYGGFLPAITGGNPSHAGTGASGMLSRGNEGRNTNTTIDNIGGHGGCGVVIRHPSGSKIYDGTVEYYWGGGGGGPAYQQYGGHGGYGGGGGGGEFAQAAEAVVGKAGLGGLNAADAGTNANSATNGGDGAVNTGSGGGGGSHRGGGQTSMRGGPGGSGIVAIRYRGA